MAMYTILCALAVDLLACSGEINLTWTSAVFPKLKSNDTSINPLGTPITSDQDAWLGSILNIGAIIGAIPFGVIADKIGRKPSLLCLAVPHFAAYVIYAFSTNIYWYYFGRFLNGIAEGASYALMPMYIAEIAEDSNRGSLSVSLSLFWALGNFIPLAIGPYLPMRTFNIILSCFPIAFFLIFLIIGVETPHYYAKINDDKKMEESLKKLRSKNRSDIEEELEEIKETFKQQEDIHVLEIFTNTGLRKALIISVLLIVLQQLAGLSAILYYMQPIFEASRTKLRPDISSTICGAWTFLTSPIIVFCTDNFGRKPPLIVSCFGMALSLILLGAYFFVSDRTNLGTSSIFWIPIFSLLFYIFAFEIGFAAMPFTISSELFPSNVKKISAPAVSVMNWFSSFIVTKFFDDIVDGIGRDGSFWIFAAFSAVAGFFTIFFVPETRGKSFSEIHYMLVK